MKGVKLPTPDDVTEEGGTLWAVRPPGGGVSEGGGAGRPSGQERACAARGRNRGGAVRCVLSEGGGRVRAARGQRVRVWGGRHRPEQGGQNRSPGQSSEPGRDRQGQGGGSRPRGRRLGLSGVPGSGRAR